MEVEEWLKETKKRVEEGSCIICGNEYVPTAGWPELYAIKLCPDDCENLERLEKNVEKDRIPYDIELCEEICREYTKEPETAARLLLAQYGYLKRMRWMTNNEYEPPAEIMEYLDRWEIEAPKISVFVGMI